MSDVKSQRKPAPFTWKVDICEAPSGHWNAQIWKVMTGGRIFVGGVTVSAEGARAAAVRGVQEYYENHPDELGSFPVS